MKMLHPMETLRRRAALLEWQARRFAAPSPDFIKRAVLLRLSLPDSTWVETGTYHGDTTALLASVAKHVVSLEPEPRLFAAAQQRFANTPNVELLGATSEDAFPELLPRLDGKVCFWLDGHFSGGLTFKGQNDTPILHELTAIEAQLPRWPQVLVLVDDLRLFNGNVHSYGPYPPLRVLVDWAERLKLTWHIEHDIFVAIKPKAHP